MSQKIQKWPGVELSQEEIDSGKIATTSWHPSAKYAWSAGEAMSRFLEELKQGHLVGRKCRTCQRILFPPRMFCEECFRPTDEWVQLKDTGTVETYSISYVDKDARRITEPIFVGVISIDGASPKMGWMHYFGEIGKEELRFGLKVKAVWEPPEHRKGSVLDVKYFRPAREGEG